MNKKDVFEKKIENGFRMEEILTSPLWPVKNTNLHHITSKYNFINIIYNNEFLKPCILSKEMKEDLDYVLENFENIYISLCDLESVINKIYYDVSYERHNYYMTYTLQKIKEYASEIKTLFEPFYEKVEKEISKITQTDAISISKIYEMVKEMLYSILDFEEVYDPEYLKDNIEIIDLESISLSIYEIRTSYDEFMRWFHYFIEELKNNNTKLTVNKFIWNTINSNFGFDNYTDSYFE